jgi:hypothetical protein
VTFSYGNLAHADSRREARDEVHHRARAFGPDARPLNVLIVNLSPHGLMARCDAPLATGDRVRIVLPVAGAVAGEVRWALGGRIGCQFDTAIDLASYYALIALLLKS